MANWTKRLTAGLAASMALAAWAPLPAQAADWVPVRGDARTADGAPICAMVLANGQFMFSCDGAGSYRLDVPLDANGEITLFAFADGFAPYRVTTRKGGFPLAVQMQTAPLHSPRIDMSRTVECSGRPGWVRVSGDIDSSAGEPLCAMVLANGQHMFSCDGFLGRYDLDVPVDRNRQVTVFGFADGFQPYKNSFAAPACDGPGRFDGPVEGSVGLGRYQGVDVHVHASGGFWADAPEVVYKGKHPDVDECVLNVDEPYDDFTFLKTLDAGVSLRVKRGDGQVLELPKNEWGTDMGYSATPDPAFYQGGQSYVFSGSGGPDVGPFETPPITAPPVLNLSSPKPTAAPDIVRHDADKPLRVVWNGNKGVGEVIASLATPDPDADLLYSILCRFADDGGAEMPASMLKQVRDAHRFYPSALAVYRMRTLTFETPDLKLDVSASSFAGATVELQ